MTTDILVKFKDFPALEIEIQKSETGSKYKELVKKYAHGTEKLIFRDPCKYTVDYMKSMVPKAKELLGWDWSSDNYLNWDEKIKLNLIKKELSLKKIIIINMTTRSRRLADFVAGIASSPYSHSYSYKY